jgi:hypothetical protein
VAKKMFILWDTTRFIKTSVGERRSNRACNIVFRLMVTRACGISLHHVASLTCPHAVFKKLKAVWLTRRTPQNASGDNNCGPLPHDIPMDDIKIENYNSVCSLTKGISFVMPKLPKTRRLRGYRILATYQMLRNREKSYLIGV